MQLSDIIKKQDEEREIKAGYHGGQIIGKVLDPPNSPPAGYSFSFHPIAINKVTDAVRRANEQIYKSAMRALPMLGIDPAIQVPSEVMHAIEWTKEGHSKLVPIGLRVLQDEDEIAFNLEKSVREFTDHEPPERCKYGKPQLIKIHTDYEDFQKSREVVKCSLSEGAYPEDAHDHQTYNKLADEQADAEYDRLYDAVRRAGEQRIMRHTHDWPFCNVHFRNVEIAWVSGFAHWSCPHCAPGYRR